MAAGDVASGFARGLTADVVGTPVDIATQLLNLGLAGYGYLGNKLGLLKPEQMPELIQNPIGGSDWFVKGTPLEDSGTAGYFAGRATGNIAPLLVGMAAKAQPPVYGQVNTFAGPSSRTADLTKLAEAKAAEQLGQGRNTIRASTGWFRGDDGNWRYEIDDSPARFRTDNLDHTQVESPANRSVPMGEIIQHMENQRTIPLFGGFVHPELQAAYPELGEISARLQKNSPMFQAKPTGQLQGKNLQARGNTEAEIREVVLHEIQHVIQAKEGFARGGNSGTARNEIYENYAKDSAPTQALRLQRLASGDPKGVAGLAPFWKNGVSPEAIAFAEDNSPQTLRDLLNNKLGISDETDFGLYRRLGGETEARNVERRANFSADERRMIPPWKTQDVPADKQFFIGMAKGE